jgi:hypothetical protein
MKIIKIENSNNKNKRFKITVVNNNDKILTFNFGLKNGDKNGSTYLDHKDKVKRYNYFNRHYNNPLERNFIDNLIPSNALYSLILLWGKYSDINKNINYYNDYISNKNKFNENMIF